MTASASSTSAQSAAIGDASRASCRRTSSTARRDDPRAQRRLEPARDGRGRVEPRPLSGQLHVLRRARAQSTATICSRAPFSSSLPGVPQVYYVGLLRARTTSSCCGAGVGATSTGTTTRGARRARARRCSALQRPVVRNLCELIRLRNTHRGLRRRILGRADLERAELVMRWRNGGELAELRVDFATPLPSPRDFGGRRRARIDLTALAAAAAGRRFHAVVR